MVILWACALPKVAFAAEKPKQGSLSVVPLALWGFPTPTPMGRACLYLAENSLPNVVGGVTEGLSQTPYGSIRIQSLI